MSSKKAARGFSVQVRGIQYPEFARLKWQQFLRIYSVVLLAAVAAVMILAVTGRLPKELPLSGAVAIILIVLAMLAVFRGGIRQEFKRSGLASMEVEYAFDRDGWTVRSGEGQATVLWRNTWRVQRSDRALLLYPNRKSVNLIPMQNLSQEQVGQIIAWCSGVKG